MKIIKIIVLDQDTRISREQEFRVDKDEHNEISFENVVQQLVDEVDENINKPTPF